MKRRFLISVLSLVLAFTTLMSVGVTASAASKTETGYMQDTSSPDNGTVRWDYTYDESSNTAKLRISGDGYMPNLPDESWIQVPAYSKCFLTEVIIEEGVKSIMENAFFGEVRLKTIKLPSTIEFVGEGAFAQTGIETFNIPAKMQDVNSNIFTGSPIKSFTVSSSNPYYKAYNGNVYSKKMTELVAVAPENYSGELWKGFTFPETVTTIGEDAFSHCTIKSITIPQHIKTIKSMAFAGCFELEELFIKNGVEEIYDSAFIACDSLNNVQLPSSVKYLGYNSFGYIYNYDFAALSQMLDYKGISHPTINAYNFLEYVSLSGFSEDAFISCLPKADFSLYAPVGSEGEKYAKTFGFSFVRSTELLSAVNTREGVRIRWSELVDGYHCSIYRKDGSSWTKLFDCDSDCTEYIDKNATKNADNIYAIEVFYWSGYKHFDQSGITCHYVEAPKLKAVSNKVNGVNVSWNPVNGATRYFIYRKLPADKSWTRLSYISANNTSYLDKTAKNGKDYYYTVIAHDGVGASSYDPVGLSLKCIAAPQFSVHNTASGVTVKWNAVGNADYYRVYRKTAKTSWVLLKMVDGTKLSYSDNTATRGSTYSYTVRAVRGDTYSGYEAAGKSIKSLAAPTVKLTNVGAGIKVYWNKCAGASGYYVYRKNSSGSWTRIANVSGGSTLSYIDKSAKTGQKYTYTLKSISGSYTSSYDSDGETIMFLTTPKVSSVKSTRSGVSLKYNTISGAKGYYIYRKTPNGNWVRVGDVKSGATSTFVDKTAKKGATYIYTVRAYNGSVRSSYYSSGIKVKVVY